MTRLLNWRDATRTDRAHLQGFACTTPRPAINVFTGVRPEHPRPWELDVQNWARTRFRPPAGHGQVKLIGEDGQGIAALAWTEQDSGPDDVFIKLAAVAMRCRNCGGQYARELLDVVTSRLLERADLAGSDVLGITAHVDRRNHPSKRLLRDLGASLDVVIAEDIERWSVVLPVPERGREVS